MEIKRIAIVTFGMLRCFEHTAPFFKRHVENSKDILERFPDCKFDYFFFGYPNSQGVEHCEIQLKKIYDPKSFKIIEWNEEVKRKIEIESDGTQDLKDRQIGATSPINCLSNHRCRNLSNKLRKDWAIKNQVDHDVVICARIDSFFFRDISIDDIRQCQEPGSVVIPGDWDFKEVHHAAISDTFAMGGEDSMDLFFESYRNFPRLVREKGYHFHPETLLGAHIEDLALKRKFCNRHIAFEYPYSDADVFGLWKENWNKEDVERILGISVSELSPRHRDNF